MLTRIAVARLCSSSSAKGSTKSRTASDSSGSLKSFGSGGRKMSLGSPFEYGADALGSNRDASRMGGTIYLLEVQYYFRLETGQARNQIVYVCMYV